MKTNIKIFSMLLIVFAIIVNPSCKKSDEEDNNNNNPSVEDKTPPQIGVTSPTAEFSYLSSASTISIAGFANDNVGVTKVLWSSSNGQSGQANGTNSWGAQNLPLSNGDNNFTFTAYDGAQNTSSTNLLVTYNEFFSFTGTLSISPQGMFVNVNTNVLCQIAILNNPNLVENSVTLIEVDPQGNLVQEFGQMYDDGILGGHGDDIQGDGVYTIQLNLMESTPGRKYMRVRVTTDETSGQVDSFSEIGSIAAVDQIPETTVQEILDVQQEALTQFLGAVGSSGFDAAITQTIDYLNASNLVVGSGQSESGDIWIEFDYGLEGMILTNEEGNEGGASRQGNERVASATVPLDKQTRGLNSPMMNQTKENENMVLDKDVMLFAPNWTQFNGWGTEFLDNINTIYTESDCPKYNVDYLKNTDANLQALRTLGSYGTIVIHTHGGVDKNNNVIFLTGDEVDYTLDEILEWVLGNVMPIPHLGKSLWAVKPSFISMNNQSYPNSIVYNGSCESAKNNTMSNAFLTKGANVYFGFSETVKSVFDRDMANALFPKLVNEGKNCGEAFIADQHDTNNPPAYFVMWGNDQTKYAAGFVNGNFEEGSLAGWNVIGDGRIISQLGYISPYAGSYMGIISTGLGYTIETGSLTQNFCVPDDATTLSLNWNFLSEEFLEYVGSQYQDFFQIAILDENGNQNVLFYKTIDNIHAEYALTLVSPGIVFDVGDVYGTDWQFSSFDISAYAGSAVTLVLSSGDVGDSIYDTVILLDEITVQ